MKQVPGSLSWEFLCFEIVNELCQINPVRNNAAETVPIRLKKCQKEKSQNRKTGYYYTGLLVCILLDSSTIWSQCFLSLLPENVRKPYGFQMFSGGRERVNIHFLQSCCFKTQDAIAVILINYNNYHCRQELFTFWLF